MENLPIVDFRSQPRQKPLPKLLNTQLSAFFWYIGFLPPLGKFVRHCPSVIKIFFSVLAAIIRENSNKLPWIENGEGFKQVAPKTSEVSAAD